MRTNTPRKCVWPWTVCYNIKLQVPYILATVYCKGSQRHIIWRLWWSGSLSVPWRKHPTLLRFLYHCKTIHKLLDSHFIKTNLPFSAQKWGTMKHRLSVLNGFKQFFRSRWLWLSFPISAHSFKKPRSDTFWFQWRYLLYCSSLLKKTADLGNEKFLHPSAVAAFLVGVNRI